MSALWKFLLSKVKNNENPSRKKSKQTVEQPKNLPHNYISELNVKHKTHGWDQGKFFLLHPPGDMFFLSEVGHDFQAVTSSLHTRSKKMRLEDIR